MPWYISFVAYKIFYMPSNSYFSFWNLVSLRTSLIIFISYNECFLRSSFSSVLDLLKIKKYFEKNLLYYHTIHKQTLWIWYVKNCLEAALTVIVASRVELVNFVGRLGEVMMNCFWGIVDKSKTLNLISRKNHCQKFWRLLSAGFKLAQN